MGHLNLMLYKAGLASPDGIATGMRLGAVRRGSTFDVCPAPF